MVMALRSKLIIYHIIVSLFVPVNLSSVWGSFTDGRFNPKNALYFSLGEEWLNKSQRFVVQFTTENNRTITKELIPAWVAFVTG